mgnify:CR=1 FL=1
MLLKKVPVYMYTDNSQNASFLANVRIIKGKHVQLKGKITTRNAIYHEKAPETFQPSSQNRLEPVFYMTMLLSILRFFRKPCRWEIARFRGLPTCSWQLRL